MAKKNEVEVIEKVAEVVEEVAKEAEVPSVNVVESDIVESDITNDLPVIPTKRGVSKNILTGVGIAAGGAIAAYGLYELVKKGVTLLRNKKEKKKVAGNGLDYPKYEYKKVESSEEGKNDESPKARKDEKVQMGFRYNR